MPSKGVFRPAGEPDEPAKGKEPSPAKDEVRLGEILRDLTGPKKTPDEYKGLLGEVNKIVDRHKARQERRGKEK